MIGFTISLPRYRVRVHLTRSRSREESILPDLGQIRSLRSGNKVSRFFRHIFEHKRLKSLLGGNLALLIVAGSLLTPTAGAFVSAEPEVVTLEVSEIPVATEAGTRLPVNGGRITQGFSFFHRGVDIDGLTGNPVYPVMAGRVERINRSDFWYGNSVLLDHGNGVETFYAHLNRITVRAGQEVSLVSQIGEVGSTGRAFGDHLHLEIYKNGQVINPYSILPRR